MTCDHWGRGGRHRAWIRPRDSNRAYHAKSPALGGPGILHSLPVVKKYWETIYPTCVGKYAKSGKAIWLRWQDWAFYLHRPALNSEELLIANLYQIVKK